MGIEYTNRKNEKYYLHKGVTTKGNPKYFFSKKVPVESLLEIPKNFEIYENPNALVFLRKIQQSKVLEVEISLIMDSLKKYSKVKFYKVETKKDSIIIYLPDQNIESLIEHFNETYRIKKDINEILNKILYYSPVMKIIIIDEIEREYIIERMHYRGHSGPDWLYLEKSKFLEKLVKKYFIHLGQESFFDLD